MIDVFVAMMLLLLLIILGDYWRWRNTFRWLLHWLISHSRWQRNFFRPFFIKCFIWLLCLLLLISLILWLILYRYFSSIGRRWRHIDISSVQIRCWSIYNRHVNFLLFFVIENRRSWYISFIFCWNAWILERWPFLSRLVCNLLILRIIVSSFNFLSLSLLSLILFKLHNRYINLFKHNTISILF